MKEGNYTHLLLDLDNTLLDFDTASEKAIAKAKEKGAEVGTKKEEPK